MFVLSMLISFAMICSCQKQDSGAEAQLAQQKVELDAREKAVAEREKAVAEREKAVADSNVIRSRRRVVDPAQAEAERQRRIQQLPPEFRALIPDRSRIEARQAQRAREQQGQSAQTQAGVQESQGIQGQSQRKFDAMEKSQMSGAARPPGAQTSSPTPSPAMETQSETESPTPQ
jgi:hypothetical protein